jgi:hypothetical protein
MPDGSWFLRGTAQGTELAIIPTQLRCVRVFESDVLKDEPLIRGCHNFVPLFRFPFFKEGNTTTKRDGIRSFLKQDSYRIGRATVDASDWAISARLENEHKLAASQLLRLTRTSCCGTSGNELNFTNRLHSKSSDAG